MSMKYIVLICLLVFSFSFVAAQPPFQTSDPTVGILVESPTPLAVKQRSDYEFHLHTYNSTNGKLLDNQTVIYCSIHIYRPSDGMHIIEKNMSFGVDNGIDWEYEVLGGNFTEIGEYQIVFTCESPNFGGFLRSSFDVTTSGNIDPADKTTFQALFLIIILAVAMAFLILSFFLNDMALKIFFFLLAWVFIMASLIQGYMISTTANVASSINTTTLSLIVVSGIILIIMFLYIMIRQTQSILRLLRIKAGKEWDVGDYSSRGL